MIRCRRKAESVCHTIQRLNRTTISARGVNCKVARLHTPRASLKSRELEQTRVLPPRAFFYQIRFSTKRFKRAAPDKRPRGHFHGHCCSFCRAANEAATQILSRSVLPAWLPACRCGRLHLRIPLKTSIPRVLIYGKDRRRRWLRHCLAQCGLAGAVSCKIQTGGVTYCLI